MRPEYGMVYICFLECCLCHVVSNGAPNTAFMYYILRRETIVGQHSVGSERTDLRVLQHCYVSTYRRMVETSPPRNAILGAIKAKNWIALKNLSLLPRGFEAARQDAW